MCVSVCVCLHALLVLWQAESVCACNEWGVSEALYCIIPLQSTPEGRKRSECSLISPYITMRVFEKRTTYFISSVSLTEAQPRRFYRVRLISLSSLVHKWNILCYRVALLLYEATGKYLCCVLKQEYRGRVELDTHCTLSLFIWKTIYPLLG